MDFKNLGFMPADILIPVTKNIEKWACVACDQYTSEPKYWEDVKTFVGGEKSTLNIIFPEVFLGNNDQDRILNINKTMQNYLDDNTFTELKNSFVYVERTIGNEKVRKGIVGAVDLERYDFNKGSTSLIRATEGTVLERIPPRVKIRENAVLELPHIMLLINDDKNKLIEPIDKTKLESLYSFDLMMNSGHIEGYRLLPDQRFYDALESLFGEEENPFVYAVGDGNHSLATAKTCWENIKKNLSQAEKETHPARFALVELVNIHDESLEFEPIHRAVFNCNPIDLIEELKKYYSTNQNGVGQKITYCYGDENREIYVTGSTQELTVGTLQAFLDEYKTKNPDIEIDYIHGQDVVFDLSKKDNTIGFILEAMEKSDLFKGVKANGALPRKTFSMGESFEKRFYIECRKIK